MTWARFDDAMPDNKKVVAVGGPGFAVHVAAVMYCNRNLTDGFVPAGKVPTLLDYSEFKPKREAIIKRLLDVGLWRFDAERGGYVLHDYFDYQPTRAEVEAEREKARLRQGRSRTTRKRKASPETDCHADVTGGVTPMSRRDFGCDTGVSHADVTGAPTPVPSDPGRDPRIGDQSNRRARPRPPVPDEPNPHPPHESAPSEHAPPEPAEHDVTRWYVERWCTEHAQRSPDWRAADRRALDAFIRSRVAALGAARVIAALDALLADSFAAVASHAPDVVKRKFAAYDEVARKSGGSPRTGRALPPTGTQHSLGRRKPGAVPKTCGCGHGPEFHVIETPSLDDVCKAEGCTCRDEGRVGAARAGA